MGSVNRTDEDREPPPPCPTVRMMYFGLDLYREIARDPVAYFSPGNRARWPRTLEHFEGLMIVNSFWAKRVFQDERVPLTWPLPVGRRALARFLADFEALDEERDDLDFHGWMPRLPFDGDELAAVVFDFDVDGCRVEAFGMVGERAESTWDAPAYSLEGAMQFRLTGANPESPRANVLRREIGHWWKLLAGQTLSPGRRRGSRHWTIDRLTRALQEYVCETADLSPSRDRFIEWGGNGGAHRRSPVDNTITTTLQSSPYQDWPDFVEAVMGQHKRVD